MDILSITNKSNVSSDAKVYTKDGNDFVTTTFDALYNNSSAKTNIEQSVSDANARIDNTNNTVAELDNYAREKANGIVLQSQGEMVTVNDSSDDYVVNLKPYGKSEQDSTTGAQLLNYDAWKNVNAFSGTAVFENNGVTISAEYNDAYTGYQPEDFPEDAKIYVSEGETVIISWEEDTKKNGLIYIFPNGLVEGSAYADNHWGGGNVSYTVPSGVTYIGFRFGVMNAGDTISYKNIMINKGSTALPYEPYTGGTTSPNPDYPQEIRSTVISEIKTVGKNWLNLTNGVDYSEQGIVVTNNKNGSYSVSGTSTTTWLKSIISVELKAGIAFVLNGGVSDKVQLSLRNSNGATIYLGDLENSANSEYTPSEDMTAYLYVRVGNGLTVNETIYPMLRVKGTDPTYEPYTETVAILSNPITLYGIPTDSDGNFTDKNGQQWIADYIDVVKGKVVRSVNSLDMSTMDWTYDSSVRFYGNPPKASAQYNNEKTPHALSEAYRAVTFSEFMSDTTLNGVFAISANGIISVRNLDYTTVEDFKLAMVGVDVIYALATPVAEDLPTADVVALKNLKTFYGVTNVTNDSEVKGEMVLSYNADTKMYIDNKFAELAAQLV